MSQITNHLKSQAHRDYHNNMRATEAHWNYAYVPWYNTTPSVRYQKPAATVGGSHNFHRTTGRNYDQYGSYPNNTVHVNVLVPRGDDRTYDLKKMVTQHERWNSILL